MQVNVSEFVTQCSIAFIWWFSYDRQSGTVNRLRSISVYHDYLLSNRQA